VDHMNDACVPLTFKQKAIKSHARNLPQWHGLRSEKNDNLFKKPLTLSACVKYHSIQFDSEDLLKEQKQDTCRTTF
jgi:hypothetical protein